MLQLNLSAFPRLSTSRLVLRAITADDAEALYQIRSDEKVMRYLDRPRMSSLEEAKKKIEEFAAEWASQSALIWGLRLKNNPRMIGTITLWHLQLEHYRAEIGYLLHPDYHRQGYMQEAVREIIRFAFEILHFHSLEAQVNPQNLASIQLLLHNGFVKEAHFRENYFYQGQFLDTAIYSLIHNVKVS